MNYIALGQRIKEERKKLNFTQERLAEAVNVSTAYIGQIERGERCPTLDTLVKLSCKLGVSIDFLLSDSISANDDSLSNLWRQLTKDSTLEEKEFIINMVKLFKNYSNSK